MSKRNNYPTLEALTPVEKLVVEAAAARTDTARTIRTSSIPDVLGAAVGTVVGGVASAAWIGGAAVAGTSGAAALTSGLAGVGAVVGGGMVAGLAVAALPVAGLAVGGYALVNRRNQKRLKDRERLLYQEALRQHQAMIEQLQRERNATRERKEYLESLVILLNDAIRRMREDLGPHALAN